MLQFIYLLKVEMVPVEFASVQLDWALKVLIIQLVPDSFEAIWALRMRVAETF